jgi:hypothetical protein
MRHYKSDKELWLKLENCYQNETQEEDKSNQSEQQDSDEESSYQDNEEDKENKNCNQIEEHSSEKNIYNLNEMQDSISVNNEEDNLIKELWNTSVFTKEKLLDFKIDVITTFEVISMELTNSLCIKVTMDVLDQLECIVICTFSELEKIQKTYMLLLHQLDQSKHEENEQTF